MPKTPQEIKAEVSAFRNNQTFTALRERWEKDFDLYIQQPYNAGRGYYSYTSNKARTLVDKLISLITSSNLIIRVPDETLEHKDKPVANNIERLLYGTITINDEKFARLPRTPSLRQQMAWHAVMRGGFGLWAYVHKDKDGKTIPDVCIWDLYNLAYGVNDKGVEWAAYFYKMPRSKAKKIYGDKISGRGSNQEVECIDYWDSETYGTIVQNDWAVTYPNLAKHCPVYVISAGATPVVFQEDRFTTTEFNGESALAPNRNLYPIRNKTLSDLVTIVRRGVKTPMILKTDDKKREISEDIFQVDKAAIIKLGSDEDLKPAIPPTMPANSIDLIGIVDAEIQQGGLPNTAYGDLGFRLSGFAINQLQGSMQTVVEPFLQALETGYRAMGREVLEQYTAGSFTPIEVRGRMSTGQSFGYPTAQEIKTSNVKGNWHPEFRLTPVLPKDDAQRLQMAKMAREGNNPLLSHDTVLTEYLGVSDSGLELSKIAVEWADQQIINKLYTAYEGYILAGQREKAANILMELRQMVAATAMQQQGGQPPRPGAARKIDAASMGTPGTGIPPGETGMSTSTMPPEAMGGFPPGAVGAEEGT